MSVNTELFQKIYDQITQHPETHEQATFEGDSSCGTTRCVAGWAIAFEEKLGLEDSIIRPGRWVEWGSEDAGVYTNSDGEPSIGLMSPYAVQARHLLGLTIEQAHELFYRTNNEQAVDMVLRYATKGDDA